jgi:hypothetical protein
VRAQLGVESAVDFKRLGTILMVGGAVLAAAAFVWWLTFYASIMRELERAPGGPPGGNSVFDAISCLYSSRDVCGFVAGFARLLGWTPYEPMVLWIGLVSLAAGIVIRLAARPGGRPV